MQVLLALGFAVLFFVCERILQATGVLLWTVFHTQSTNFTTYASMNLFLGVLQYAWNVTFAVLTLVATFASGILSRTRAMLALLFIALSMLYLYEYEARLFLELREDWNSGTGSVVRGIIYIPLDLFRQVLQAVLPVYNLVVWCSVQVLRILVFGATADGESFLGIVASLADMTKALVESVVGYSTTFEPCARVNNVTDAACYEAGLRQFDLQSPLTHLGVAVTFTMRFVNSNCGSLAGILNVALYPFTDPLFIEGMHNVANAPLYAVFQMPVVTWERSRQEADLGKLAGVLKTPDLNPVFDFAVKGVRQIGQGLDNWLDIVALTVEELFFGSAPVCPAPTTEQDLPGPDPELFGTRETRVVALTDGMYAITDGISVEYVEHQRSVQRKVALSAWPLEIDVRMGIAAVRYSEEDETDNTGSGTTAMFGCACFDIEDDTTYQGTRLELTCAILPFTEETSFQVVDYVLPTRFHVASTSGYATCDTMTFSVQSVRWPLTRIATPDVSTVSPALYNQNNRFSRDDVGDRLSPSVADAVVWATPRCDVSGAFSNYVCTPGFVDSGCYPYCLAVRPAASGNSVLTFYNANEWSEKVHLLQRLCDPSATVYSADAPPAGGWTASTVFPKGDLAGNGYSSDTGPVEACEYNREAVSIVDRSRLPGYEAPTSALLDDQPYVFAGDAALFVDRNTDELYVKRLYGEGNWQMTVSELPRRIPVNAACRDISNCPQDAGWDANKVTVAEGFASSPGVATAAVATRWSVFHVVNPSADVYSEFFNNCRYLAKNESGTTGFQITSKGSYSKPRVWRIDAFARDLGLVDDIPDYRIPWSVDFEGYDGRQSLLECSAPRNMSIVSISYINERNVAITVLEATPAYFNPLTQRAYADAPVGTGEAVYKIYYLDPLTMSLQRHRLWTDSLKGAVTTGTLCPELKRMPTFGSMFGEAAVAAIEAMRMPANALLSIPVIKDLEALNDLRSCPLVTRGHSLLRECGINMFSMDRFFEALLHANTHFWRSFSYLSVQLQGSPRAQSGRVLLNGISVYFGNSKNVISQAIRKRAMDAFKDISDGGGGEAGGFASVSMGARAGVAGYTPSIIGGSGRGLGFGAFPSRVLQGPVSFVTHVPSTSLRLAGQTLGFLGSVGTEASSIGTTLGATSVGPLRWVLRGVVSSLGFTWWSYNTLLGVIISLLSSGTAERTPLELIWSKLYDARADFRVKVTHSCEKACTGMLLLFGGDGAIAEAAYAFCSAGVYVADGFFEMLTVVAVDYVVMDCVCGAPGGVSLSEYVEDYCIPSAPEAYAPAVRTAVGSLEEGNGPKELCTSVVTQANDKLLHSFDLAFAAAYDLAEASAGVFQQIIDWMPGDQGSCRGFYSSPELVTIMPTPMDYWRVCGNTSACRMKCTDLLQAFDEALERDKTFGVKVSEYTTLVEKPYINPSDMLEGRGKPPFEVLAMIEPSDCADICGNDMDNNTVDGYVRDARCVQVAGIDRYERLEVVLYCIPSQLGVSLWRKGNWSVFGSEAWTGDLVDVHFSTNVVKMDPVTKSLASPLVVVRKSGIYLYSEHGIIQRLVRLMLSEMYRTESHDVMHIIDELLVQPGARPVGNEGLERDAMVLVKGSSSIELLNGEIQDVAQCTIFSFTASSVTFSSSSISTESCQDVEGELITHHTQKGNRVPIYISRDLSQILFMPVVDGVDMVVCENVEKFKVSLCVTSSGIKNPMTDAGLAGVRGTYGGIQGSSGAMTFRKSRAVSTTCMLELVDETSDTSRFGIFSAAHGSEVWFSEVRVMVGSVDRIPKSVTRTTSSPQPIVVTNARQCSTRTCSGCNSIHTQKVCYAAQQCVISRCIGTPVNFRTPLCAWGGIIKEMLEASTSSAVSVWFSVYDVVALVVNGQTGILEEKVYVSFPHEAMSMMLCEAKDLVTMVVASITSMVSSAIFLERTTADLNAFSPEATNEMIAQTTMATAAITSMFSHLGQLPLYLVFSMVQMLTCTVNDIAMVFDFTGKEVRFGRPETLEAFGSVGGQCVTVLVGDEAEQLVESQDAQSRLSAAISDSAIAAANTYVAADGWKHGVSVAGKTAKMGYNVNKLVAKGGVLPLKLALYIFRRGVNAVSDGAWTRAEKRALQPLVDMKKGARNSVNVVLEDVRKRIGQLRAGGAKNSKFVSEFLRKNRFTSYVGQKVGGAGYAIGKGSAALGKGLGAASKSAGRGAFAGMKGLLGRALGRPLRGLMMAPMKMSMHFLDAGMAWMIGLVRTVQDVIQSADRQHCKLPDATSVDIPTCACGDHAATIPPFRSAQTASDGALWCSGTLDLVQSDGSSHIIFNPYSLSELRGYMGTADEYMACVADASNEKCDTLRPTAPELESQGADLLTVVTRCRSNYVNKQWDQGAAFAFAPELIQEFTGFAGTIISLFKTESFPDTVVDCMFVAIQNNLGNDACLSLYLLSNDITADEYFTYDMHDIPYEHSLATTDACEVFTGPAERSSVFAQCIDSTTSPITANDDSDDDRECDMEYFLWSGRSSNKVPLATGHHKAYRDVAERVSKAEAMISEEQERMSRIFEGMDDWTADDLQLVFYTADGDGLHQAMDCMVMGPYAAADLWPGPSDVMAAVRYSRTTDPSDFEQLHRKMKTPCGSAEDVGEDTDSPFTCGSPTRKAVLKSFVRDNLHLTEAVEALVQEKITELRDFWLGDNIGGCRAVILGVDGTVSFSTSRQLESCSNDYVGEWTSYLDEETTSTPVQGDKILGAVVDKVEQFVMHGPFMTETADVISKYYAHGGLASQDDLSLTPEQLQKLLSYGLFDPTQVTVFYGMQEVLKPLTSSLLDLCTNHLQQFVSTHPMLEISSEKWVLLGMQQAGEFDPMKDADYARFASKLEETMHDYAREAWYSSPFYWSYVTRFVPSDSLVCRNHIREYDMRAKGDIHIDPSTVPIHNVLGLAALAADMEGEESPVFAKHGFLSGTLGELHGGTCVCDWHLEGQPENCTIPEIICSAASEWGYVDVEVVCAEGRVYDMHTESVLLALYDLLRAFHADNRELQERCHMMGPSDRWGMHVSDASVEKWLEGNVFSLSLADIISEGRGGMRLGALHATARDWSTVLHEGIRTVPVVHPNEAMRFTTVAQRTCVSDVQDAFPTDANLFTQRYIDELFPLAHVIQENMPSTYCTRFALELGRKHFMDIILESGVELPELSEQGEAVVLWRERCRAQLGVVAMCQVRGAYVNAPWGEMDMRNYLKPGTTHDAGLHWARVWGHLSDEEAESVLASVRAGLEEEFLGDTPSSMDTQSFMDTLTSPEVIPGVFNTKFDGSDWRTAEGILAAEHCDAVFDWWPDDWQDPMGYQVTTPPYHDEAGYRSFDNGFVVERDGGFVFVHYEHSAVRNQTLASNHYGASGYCGIHTAGMDMREMNRMRTCSRMGTQTEADPTVPVKPSGAEGDTYFPEQCSPEAKPPWVPNLSPLVRQGAGLLNFWDGRGLYDWPPTDGMGEGMEEELPQLPAFNDVEFGTTCPFLSLLTCTDDSDCIPVNSGQNLKCLARATVRDGTLTHDTGVCSSQDVECVNHDGCSQGLMCSGDGQCVVPVLVFKNDFEEEVFAQVFTEECTSEFTEETDMWGASLFQSVDDALPSLGMCSFRNWFEYTELMKTQETCTASSVTCDVQGRSAMIRHTAATSAPSKGSLWKEGKLKISPSPCDRDYMHLSNMKECHTKTGVVESDGESEHSVQKENALGWTFATHRKTGELPLPSFLGHQEEAYFFTGSEAPLSTLFDVPKQQSNMKRCVEISQCTLQPFTVNGVTVSERRSMPAAFIENCSPGLSPSLSLTGVLTHHCETANTQLQAQTTQSRAVTLQDVFSCGPFGLALTTSVSGDVEQCIIDPAVAGLWYVICTRETTYHTVRTACLIDDSDFDPCEENLPVYNVEDRVRVTDIVNGLFTYFKTGVLKDTTANLGEYAKTITCTEKIFDALLKVTDYHAPSYTAVSADASLDNAKPLGLYYATDFALTEFPFAWWVMCTLFQNIQPTENGVSECLAWQERYTVDTIPDDKTALHVLQRVEGGISHDNMQNLFADDFIDDPGLMCQQGGGAMGAVRRKLWDTLQRAKLTLSNDNNFQESSNLQCYEHKRFDLEQHSDEAFQRVLQEEYAIHGEMSNDHVNKYTLGHDLFQESISPNTNKVFEAICRRWFGLEPNAQEWALSLEGMESIYTTSGIPVLHYTEMSDITESSGRSAYTKNFLKDKYESLCRPNAIQSEMGGTFCVYQYNPTYDDAIPGDVKNIFESLAQDSALPRSHLIVSTIEGSTLETLKSKIPPQDGGIGTHYETISDAKTSYLDVCDTTLDQIQDDERCFIGDGTNQELPCDEAYDASVLSALRGKEVTDGRVQCSGPLYVEDGSRKSLFRDGRSGPLCLSAYTNCLPALEDARSMVVPIGIEVTPFQFVGAIDEEQAQDVYRKRQAAWCPVPGMVNSEHTSPLPGFDTVGQLTQEGRMACYGNCRNPKTWFIGSLPGTQVSTYPSALGPPIFEKIETTNDQNRFQDVLLRMPKTIDVANPNEGEWITKTEEAFDAVRNGANEEDLTYKWLYQYIRIAGSALISAMIELANGFSCGEDATCATHSDKHSLELRRNLWWCGSCTTAPRYYCSGLHGCGFTKYQRAVGDYDPEVHSDTQPFHFQLFTWVTNLLIAETLSDEDYYYHLKPSRDHTPYFGVPNLNVFTEFNSVPASDYLNSISSGDESLETCAKGEEDYTVDYTRCSNFKQISAIQHTVEEEWKMDAFLRVPPGMSRAMRTSKEQVTGHTMYGFSAAEHEREDDFMSWVTDGEQHCPKADIHTSICFDDNTRPVLFNPWTGGNFNPSEFCDTPAFPQYGGLRIDSGCNSNVCPKHHERNSQAGDDPFHENMARQCIERDGNTPFAQLPIQDAPTNLCTHRPRTQDQCRYAQGALGGSMVWGEETVRVTDGDRVESLYAESENNNHRVNGGMLQSDFNGLLRGFSRQNSGLVIPSTASVSPQDIGGHAIQFTVDAKGSMLVDRMVLEGHNSMEEVFQALRRNNAGVGSLEWLQNYEAIVDAERGRTEIPPGHYSFLTEENSIHWACPYRRLSHWGGYADETPILPDPRRTRRLFGPVNRGSSVHPMQSVHSASWKTKRLYTSNGFCFCADPLDCSFSVNATNPCSLISSIESTYNRKAYHTVQLSPDCDEHMDWPFAEGVLRDGSTARSNKDPGQCSSSKRLPPFQVRLKDVGFTQGLYGRTTSSEGGDCHMGAMAQKTGEISESFCRLAHKNTTHMAFNCEKGVHVEVLREKTKAPSWIVDRLQTVRRKCTDADPPPEFKAGGEKTDAASSFGQFMRVSPERYVSGELARTTCNALGMANCESVVEPTHWKMGTFLHTLLTNPASLFNSSFTNYTGSAEKDFAEHNREEQQDDPVWDVPWVACKTDRDGTAQCNGTISREEWADPLLRAGACKRVLQEHTDNDLAMDLEICNLDERLADLCREIANMRATIRTANCIAAGSCFNQYFFYYPGTYSVTNDEFVHDSVRKFYLLRDQGSCPLTEAQETLITQNNDVRYRCAASQLEPVVVTLEYLRLTLQKLVRIMYYFFMMVIKFLELIPAAFDGSDFALRVQRIMEQILLYLQLLIEEIKDMIDQLGNFVLEFMLRSPWGEKLRTLIYEICRVINIVLDVIETVICPILQAVHWFVQQVLKALSDIRDWDTKVFGKPFYGVMNPVVTVLQEIANHFGKVAECEWAKGIPCDRIQTETGTEDGTLPTPTRCWTQFVATLGDENILSCTGADTCELEDGTRVVCDQCPLQSSGIMDYGCDPIRKVCKCGVPVNEKTPCTAHHQCLDDSGSQCAFLDTGSEQTFGSIHCSHCSTRAMCVLDDGGVSGHCSCPLQHTSFEACPTKHVGELVSVDPRGLCLTVLGANQQRSTTFTADYASTAGIPCRLVESSRSYCYNIQLSPVISTSLIVARDYFSVGGGRRLLEEEQPLLWDDVTGLCKRLMQQKEAVGEQGMAVTDYFAMQECAKWRGVGISLVRAHNLTGVDDHFLLSVADFVKTFSSPQALIAIAANYHVLYDAFKHSHLARSMHRVVATVERVLNARREEALQTLTAPTPETINNKSKEFFNWQKNIAIFADRSLVHIPQHRERQGFRHFRNRTSENILNSSRRLMQTLESEDLDASVLRPDRDPVFNSAVWGSSECAIGEGLLEMLKVGGSVFIKQYSGQAPTRETPEPRLAHSYPRIDKSVRADVQYLNQTGQLMPGPESSAGEPDVLLSGIHVVRGWVDAMWNSRQWAFTLYSTFPETVEKIMTCDLEKVVFCTAYKRTLLHSLIWVLVANFLVSQAAVGLNLPLVARAFFWVIPLLTLFYAMEYSPFCLPIIPPCLVDELVDLAGYLIPSSVLIPNSLQVYPGCLDGAPPPANTSLVHNASTNASCLVSCFDTPHSFYTSEAPLAWWLCDMDVVTCEEFGLWLKREAVPYTQRLQNFIKEKAAIVSYQDTDLIAAQRFCATLTSWYLLPWTLALGFVLYMLSWSLTVPVVALQGYVSLFFASLLQLHVSVSTETEQLYNVYIQQDIRQSRKDGGAHLRQRMFRPSTS